MEQIKKVAVIGGGASGYFAAIALKTNYKQIAVSLFEKSDSVLAKVKISGGGRCNVTHACFDIETLCQAYPRGGRKLKKIFYQFGPADTFVWFKARGVVLKTEKDGRVFPVSDNSKTIIDCLVKEARKLGVLAFKKAGVKTLKPVANRWKITFIHAQHPKQYFDAVVVATGGGPKKKHFDWLKPLGHQIVPPVPSLFTFNMPNEGITRLMGIAVANAIVRIAATKIQTRGPLLITHWGMSGPAILKASALGARILNDLNYSFKIYVNWTGITNTEAVFQHFWSHVQNHPSKPIKQQNIVAVPQRLWCFVLEKNTINLNQTWNMLGKKQLRKLVESLTQDTYSVQGKTAFKEEFVTSGGVKLNEVNLNTMESKKMKNLYFAGEVLDIDAITGGYNFQAAWSTGFIAGKLGQQSK